MDIVLWVALGAVVLTSVSLAGGLIIRKTQRTQKGGSFYVSMFVMLLGFGYGVIPWFALAGLERAAAYGFGAAVSALASQFLFGEKIPHPKK